MGMGEVGCEHCASEAEPGWIETDNNGPIVPCPLCNRRPVHDDGVLHVGPSNLVLACGGRERTNGTTTISLAPEVKP